VTLLRFMSNQEPRELEVGRGGGLRITKPLSDSSSFSLVSEGAVQDRGWGTEERGVKAEKNRHVV